MDYLEQVEESYSYFNDMNVYTLSNQQATDNYSYFNDYIVESSAGNLYNETVNENYSYLNDALASIVIKVQENYSYNNTIKSPLKISESIQESYSYNTSLNVGKMIVLSFNDNYGYSNQVSTTADYLQSIADNYNIKTVVTTYKEVNGNLELDDSLDCWVVNYETNALSRYNNYVFDSFAHMNGNVYGVNELGIFKLGGNTDADKEIKSKVLTGSIDISGIGSQTYVRDMFLYHKSDGTLRLNVIANDGRVENYRLLNTSDETISSKLTLSKGRKAIYWQFELTNDDQTIFELEKIKVYRLVTGKIT